MKIISGGQTGADRAALDVAIELKIEHGGWLPRGRKAEDGSLDRRYRLQELDSANYRDRTRKNIQASDATLIISFGELTGGSALTKAFVIRYDRPFLHLDMEQVTKKEGLLLLEKWLISHEIKTLNVAGPRESGQQGIYNTVKTLLLAVDWKRKNARDKCHYL